MRTGLEETFRKIDPLATALSLLNGFAGSTVAEQLSLRKPAERLAYLLTRTGFQAATEATRRFRSAGELLRPERPGRPEAPSDLFDLRPTEEQAALLEPVRQFAEREIRPPAADADEACATPESLLRSAHALGIVQLVIPEALGGLDAGRSPVSSVLVAEELARGDMGIAVSVLAPVAVANALALWGTADQQERYLPPFTGDDPFAASFALVEPRPLFDPLALDTKARRRGDGFVLTGTKSLVPLATTAELFLVAADLEKTGPALFLVERGSAGVEANVDPAMGVRAGSLGRLELRDAAVPGRCLLGDGCVEYRDVVDLARLGWCALAVGTAQAVLDYVIPYVNERVAFGEPISHRQSVAFLVSNIATELDSMRLLVRRAACRAERGLPFHHETTLAHTFAAEKAMEIGTNGVQLLGGHGFIKEHPVERWYRDLRAIAVMEGGVLA